MKSRGLEVSFAWIFAIIVGAVILFLALYTTFNFVSEGQQQTDTEVAAQLVALLSPVETTIESGKYAQVKFNARTRITNKCSSLGTFGDQSIGTQVKSGLGNTWGKEGIAIRTENKYVFSDVQEEGTTLNLFVKPFYAPYKVADLIIATSNDYCFVRTPEEVEDELKTLGMPHITFVTEQNRCLTNAIRVCFSGTGCSVQVDMDRRSVSRQGKTVYFDNFEDRSLVYAAIFSDPTLYECQVKRLMKRTGELAELYARKADLLQGSGCSSGLGDDLRDYSHFVSSITSSGSLGSVTLEAQRLGDANNVLSCRLF